MHNQETNEPGCAVTIEDVNNFIVSESGCRLGLKTTAVVLTLKNGFEVVGTSGCVNPESYNQEIGEKYARQKAVDQVWLLLGFMAQQTRHSIKAIEKEIAE